MKKMLALTCALTILSLPVFANDQETKYVTEEGPGRLVTTTVVQPEKPSMRERLKEIERQEQRASLRNTQNMPKVAVMYINNSQTTYDEDIDNILLPALKTAINEDTYSYIDGTPYVEKLNKIGIVDITTAERADIIDAFEGEDLDYAVFVQVDPFIRKDKMTFFTVGKEMTSIVPFKIIDIKNNKYLYNGKFTEVAKDSSMVGGIGNKSVALKALDKVSEEMSAIIDVRLPKEKQNAQKN
ncbi:hypothetical protein [Phascolarctobacterium sp.]|uniref:hypothetical protein n=2 Tax=Phascolarctobacterium TaxID=33024 RepID=UPI0030259391